METPTFRSPNQYLNESVQQTRELVRLWHGFPSHSEYEQNRQVAQGAPEYVGE